MRPVRILLTGLLQRFFCQLGRFLSQIVLAQAASGHNANRHYLCRKPGGYNYRKCEPSQIPVSVKQFTG